MVDKIVLKKWVVDALVALGGTGTIVDVGKYIWEHHEDDLRGSGDMFYTWQYDIRWAKQQLRDSGILEEPKSSGKGVWRLTSRRG